MPLNISRTAKEEAPATAPVAEEVVATEEVKAEGAAVNAEGEGFNQNVGSWSNKIAFVKCLTNPLRDDVVTIKIDGKAEKKITPFICGYRFQALEDIEVPDCGTTINFKKDPMNFNDINGKKMVKAGETFDMTPFEVGLIASWPEFNQRFTGGEHPVTCGLMNKEYKNKLGATQEVQIKEFPRAILRLVGPGQIKDLGWENVCEKKIEMTPDGREVKKGVIIPGFEKFAPLCETAPKSGARAASGAKAAGKKANIYSASARAFMELAAGKGYVR